MSRVGGSLPTFWLKANRDSTFLMTNESIYIPAIEQPNEVNAVPMPIMYFRPLGGQFNDRWRNFQISCFLGSVDGRRLPPAIERSTDTTHHA